MSPAWPTDPVNADHFTGARLRRGRGRPLPEHHRADGRRNDRRSASCSWGTAWSEPRLVELAYAYEQASKGAAAPAADDRSRRRSDSAGDLPALAHDEHEISSACS